MPLSPPDQQRLSALLVRGGFMRVLAATLIVAGGVVLRFALPAAPGAVHVTGSVLLWLAVLSVLALAMFPCSRRRIAGRGRRSPRDAAGRRLDEKPFDGIL